MNSALINRCHIVSRVVAERRPVSLSGLKLDPFARRRLRKPYYDQIVLPIASVILSQQFLERVDSNSSNVRIQLIGWGRKHRLTDEFFRNLFSIERRVHNEAEKLRRLSLRHKQLTF